MARRKQLWRIGDIFAVATRDGRFGVGQVVGREPNVLNSVSIALFEHHADRPDALVSRDYSESQVFSIVFSTRDLLDSGAWRIVGHKEVHIRRNLLPFEATRELGWVGAKVVGSGIVNKFVEAYFGLIPWDDWHDPRYLDKLLAPWATRPKSVMLNSSP